MPRWLSSVRAIALLSWLVLALGWTGHTLRGELAAARDTFEPQSRIVHRLLTQRAEQHDAVLAALVALQASSPEAPPAQWRAFAGSIAAAYSQVAGISRADVPLVGARDTGFELARAAADGTRFVLVVRADRLLDASELHALDVTLSRDDGTLLWRHRAPRTQAPWPAGLFEPLHFEKHLDSRSQPYLVTTAQPALIAPWPWARWIGGLVGLALVCVLAAWAVEQVRARRLAQRQLALAHAARVQTLGEVASGIAHELNQPLAAILSTSQAMTHLLDDDPPDVAGAARASASVAQQAQRAGAIVHRLREFIAPQAREAQAVDLNRVVHDALALVEQTLRSRRVKPVLDLGDALPAVRGDPIAFEQVVVNLVLNAADAIDAGASGGAREVRVTTRREGASVSLLVADTGPGIAPATLARVFEPFFTTKPQRAGLGLGLTICEHIVLQAGGAIVAQNVGEGAGEGALFTVRLPAATAAA